MQVMICENLWVYPKSFHSVPYSHSMSSPLLPPPLLSPLPFPYSPPIHLPAAPSPIRSHVHRK